MNNWPKDLITGLIFCDKNKIDRSIKNGDDIYYNNKKLGLDLFDISKLFSCEYGFNEILNKRNMSQHANNTMNLDYYNTPLNISHSTKELIAGLVSCDSRMIDNSINSGADINFTNDRFGITLPIIAHDSNCVYGYKALLKNGCTTFPEEHCSHMD